MDIHMWSSIHTHTYIYTASTFMYCQVNDWHLVPIYTEQKARRLDFVLREILFSPRGCLSLKTAHSLGEKIYQVRLDLYI